jgi:THO complex subunit 2
VRGDLPPQKSRVALESVVFVEEAQREEELGSVLADIIAHLGQDVSICNSLLGSVVVREIVMTLCFIIQVVKAVLVLYFGGTSCVSMN